MGNFVQKNYKSFFLLIITLVGVIGSLGYILKIPEMQLLGYLTAASPTPLVFNQFNGLEYWASNGKVDLVFADGSQASFPFDQKLFHKIRGPHIRKIAAIIPFSLAPVLNDAQVTAQVSAAFCRGLLAPDIGLNKRVASVQLSIESPTKGREFKWQRRYQCI